MQDGSYLKKYAVISELTFTSCALVIEMDKKAGISKSPHAYNQYGFHSEVVDSVIQSDNTSRN